MLRNYLIVAFRNLVKNRIFTLINISGLGIALAVCIVAFFNHMFNYEFDRTHENFDEIYRVTSFRDMEGREQEYGIVPATLGLEIKKDIPGVARAARVMRSLSPVREGEDIFPASIAYVDPEFVDIFTFTAVSGDIRSVSGQGNVILSQSMAKRLFGDESPQGRTISIVNDKNAEFTYTVAGVFADLPENSSFRIDILSHIDNFLLMWQVKDADWKLWANAMFVQVPQRSLVPAITRSMKDYLPVQNRAREDFRITRFNLVPLKDVGESSRNIWSSGLFPSLHPAALIAPPVMAIFILLIACFNFANTSIATFSRRLKEIALRKTFGGQRSQLITQFMSETFIICMLAMLTGVAVSAFLVPAYSSLWEYMTIELTFGRYAIFWIFLFLLLLVTGFVAGVYPAIYVSSFTPVKVLKGTSGFRGSGKLSSALLTMQFAISLTALIMGIVFSRNADYQRTLDLGYDRDKLLVVPVAPEHFASFRNEIQSNPGVISAEGTDDHVGWGGYRRPIKYEQRQLEVDVLDVGPGYAGTMGFRLKQGRLFEPERVEADRSGNSIVINQKMADDFGWDDPVGKSVTLYDTTRLTVIGVVEDFYTSGLWEKIEPAMLRLSADDQYRVIAVRAEAGDLPAVLEFTGKKWKELPGTSIFRGQLQEDLMQEEKDINDSILKVNLFLAIVATILSLVGMYNLVSLDIIRRTKEVGIRKIQGASVPSIMLLVSKKYFIILSIASVLGCAGGYKMSLMLLDSIWDYFVDIRAGILVFAVLLMFIATILTISIKVIAAAMRNPVDSLRYE
ncbi:ABC transporter permease [bacterium]|nr:ABC transporter permease [bacterium]